MITTEMQEILAKIKAYDNIIIFRHLRPDGDAVGSSMGLREILRISFPEKNVLLINSDYSDYVAFLGGEDDDVSDEVYSSALGIVVDTATSDRISNRRYTLCKELIKIDHHVDVEAYALLSWVEDWRSSCCELITRFYYEFQNELKLNSDAAFYLYTGMVTDSGRFRFRSVSGDTMRLAGLLLDSGINTEKIYSNLYVDDFEVLKFKSYIINKIKRTPNGVAYLYIDRSTREKFNMSLEDAAATVSYMDSIRGSLIWIAFIKYDDDSTRVRLRSRRLAIRELAEKYNGGGHDTAAGAIVNSKAEMKRLLADADRFLAEYKANNGDCL